MKMWVLTSIVVREGKAFTRTRRAIYGFFWYDWKTTEMMKVRGLWRGGKREGLLQLQIVDDSSTYLWLWDALISTALVGKDCSDNFRSHIDDFIHSCGSLVATQWGIGWCWYWWRVINDCSVDGVAIRQLGRALMRYLCFRFSFHVG